MSTYDTPLTENEVRYQNAALADENRELHAQSAMLRVALERLHNWARASNDWRPDASLGRQVRAVLGQSTLTAKEK